MPLLLFALGLLSMFGVPELLSYFPESEGRADLLRASWITGQVFYVHGGADLLS